MQNVQLFREEGDASDIRSKILEKYFKVWHSYDDDMIKEQVIDLEFYKELDRVEKRNFLKKPKDELIEYLLKEDEANLKTYSDLDLEDELKSFNNL